MNPLQLLEILQQQRASGYPDVAGAHASVTIPLSDRLVATLVRENLPLNAPVREIDLKAQGENRFTVRVRLTRPALLPPVSVNLFIEHQPRLPEQPFLVLRVGASGGLMSLAGVALRFFSFLPPGIEMDGDRIVVNLRALLEQRGAGEVLDYVEHLEVMAEQGRFVISARGGLPGG